MQGTLPGHSDEDWNMDVDVGPLGDRPEGSQAFIGQSIYQMSQRAEISHPSMPFGQQHSGWSAPGAPLAAPGFYASGPSLNQSAPPGEGANSNQFNQSNLNQFNQSNLNQFNQFNQSNLNQSHSNSSNFNSFNQSHSNSSNFNSFNQSHTTQFVQSNSSQFVQSNSNQSVQSTFNQFAQSTSNQFAQSNPNQFAQSYPNQFNQSGSNQFNNQLSFNQFNQSSSNQLNPSVFSSPFSAPVPNQPFVPQHIVFTMGVAPPPQLDRKGRSIAKKKVERNRRRAAFLARQ